MSFKLVALDLDGTLLNEENELSKRNIDTISRVQSLGVNVVIATGRMFVSAREFASRLNLPGPVISYNGAYVKDISQQEVLFHQPIDMDTALNIIHDCQEKGLHLNLYQDDRLYVERENDKARLYAEISDVELNEVGPLDKYINQPPTKLLIIEDNRKRHQKVLKYFQDEYNEKLAATESKRNYIEFLQKGVSKGHALAFISDYLHINQEDVISIGDSWNDIEMLEWSGLGVAMGNAVEKVQQKADLVAPTNRDDGVAQILKKIFEFK